MSTRSLALASLVALVACADAAPDPDLLDAQEEARPSYSVRLDSESSDPFAFELVEDDDGIRVQTGPAGIAYRADDVVVRGDMHLQATFLQFGAPIGYREAFGLFVGGVDLQGPDIEYTYLLVRTTGDYLVKRRVGPTTQTLADWTPHPSVRRVVEEGDEPVNILSIDVYEGESHSAVNGDVVHVEPSSRVRPYGTAGVRVNHRLDVRVDGWLLSGEGDSS
jgi:hypothetical protein